MAKAGVTPGADEGVVVLGNSRSIAGFVGTAKKARIWEREKKVRFVP